MQEGIRHQCCTTENASEQRARRLNAEPASNDETIAEAGSFYLRIVNGKRPALTAKTLYILDILIFGVIYVI